MEYAHNRTIDRSSPFIRFYLWLWPEAEAENIDTCRLFWGYFPPFLLLNLIVRVLGYPFYKLATGVIIPWLKIRAERKNDLMAMSNEQLGTLIAKETEKARRPSRASRILSAIGRAADRVVGALQAQWGWLRYLWFGLVGGLALAGAAVLLWAIYLLVTAPWIWSAVLIFIGMAISITCFISVIYFFAQTRRGVQMAKEFGSALKQGFRGVHTRTCAKIDLR